MKTETKHTATPWELHDFEITNEIQKGLVKAVPIYTGRIKGTLSPVSDDWDEAQANAAFIVRAVNSHKMLVDALKNATRVICELIPEDPAYPEFSQTKKDLMEAIARAEARS